MSSADEAAIARAVLLHVRRLGALTSTEETERHKRAMTEARDLLAQHLPESERADLPKWWEFTEAPT